MLNSKKEAGDGMNNHYIKWKQAFNVIGLMVWSVCITAIIANYQALPDQVPSHYNVFGKADAWAQKWFIFFIPIIGLALWIFLHQLEKHPKYFNMPGFGPKANEAQVANVQLMGNVIKNETLLLLSSFSLKDTYVLLGNRLSLGIWEIIIFLGVYVITIVFFVIRNVRLR